MIKKLQVNAKLFLEYFKKAMGFVFGIASAILLFLDKGDLKINSYGSEIIAMLILIFIALVYAFIKVLYCKKMDYIKGKLVLRYGDLLKTAFSAKEEKKIVVIGVNTTFDTIVDEDLATVNKPLVSPTTIHGKWINCMEERNVAISEIDAKINDNLKIQRINPVKMLSRDIKNRGKLKSYSKGTIVQYEYGNTIFYLVALSEFDENNNAQNEKEELVYTIIKLINYYDKKGNGFDIYIPLLGTGQSRTGITKKDSLKIITSLFGLYEEKLQGCVNVIIYSKDRGEISLKV